MDDQLSGATTSDVTTTEADTTGAATTDYEAVGGGPAIGAVVSDFYDRVLGDPGLAPYFDDVDLGRLKRHQALLVASVLGGPEPYTGRPLDQAHAGMGIDHEDFSAVVGHLASALKDAGVPDDIIGRAGAAVVATEPSIVESPS